MYKFESPARAAMVIRCGLCRGSGRDSPFFQFFTWAFPSSPGVVVQQREAGPIGSVSTPQHLGRDFAELAGDLLEDLPIRISTHTPRPPPPCSGWMNGACRGVQSSFPYQDAVGQHDVGNRRQVVDMRKSRMVTSRCEFALRRLVVPDGLHGITAGLPRPDPCPLTPDSGEQVLLRKSSCPLCAGDQSRFELRRTGWRGQVLGRVRSFA